MNGSPLANPLSYQDENDQNESLGLSRSIRASLVNRKGTLKGIGSNQNGEDTTDTSKHLERPSFAISVPLEGGGSLELDTAEAANVNALGADAKKQVAEQLRLLQEQLNSYLSAIE